MTFRPCFVVPAFDPGPALRTTVEGLAAWGLPIYVTDDGSAESTRTVLAALAAADPKVRPARLEPNQGKGAAVMDGFRRAAADGCTHAFQVDADHQHDLGAAGAFLETARARPEAVIAGYPIFDGTVPLARKYGRLFNDVWVDINTRSRDVKDSLCGFRIYPLAATLDLMDRVALPARMVFDTEIIVRLRREGTPVVSAPVAVTYPEGGATHFRGLTDTLRLIFFHGRFFLGLAPRARRRDGSSQPWYRIRERGGLLGLRTVLGIHRLLGPGVVRTVATLATPYFYLTGRRARRASRDYLTRLHRHCGPLPGLPGSPGAGRVFAHFRAFSRSTVDKFLAWSGHRKGLDVVFPDFQALRDLRERGTGAIFLGAHLGNLEMIRALGAEHGLTGLNAVVYSENAVRFHDMLRRVNPAFSLDLIQVSQISPDTAIRLQEKVERGEFLFIVGDRPPPADTGRTVSVPFLGSPAPFPVGPFLLAHLLRCPVYLLFCCREAGTYRVHMERLADRIELPRRDREAAIAHWAGRYAHSLEARCRQTPFEWFNFFDFWSSHPSA